LAKNKSVENELRWIGSRFWTWSIEGGTRWSSHFNLILNGMNLLNGGIWIWGWIEQRTKTIIK